MKEENKIRVVRLHFNAPLHLHGHSEDYANSLRNIHSDTLYSAILQMWNLLGEDNLLSGFADATWTISSLFPFVSSKGDQYTYFFPRPIKSFDTESVQENFRGKMKRLKKIQWLDLDFFTEHIQEDRGAKIHPDNIYENEYLSKEKVEKFIFSSIDPHANIPRFEGETTPYLTERIYFKSNSGLFFIFMGSNDEFEGVKKALSLLQHEGIGSDRSLGNGRFEVQIETDCSAFMRLFNLISPYSSNLSLFLPESSEQLQAMVANPQSEKTSWTLLKRGGWITAEPYLTFQKKPLFMFGEGSVFLNTKTILGKTEDAKPIGFDIEHPIFRVGRSLFVPINL